MTTDDTTTQAPASTEGTETEQTQRSAHELLKLKTFQGMTDAEIQSIIDYRVSVAHDDEVTKLAQATEIQVMNAQCAAYDALRDDANSVLKKVLAVPLSLGTVSQDGTVTHQ